MNPTIPSYDSFRAREFRQPDANNGQSKAIGIKVAGNLNEIMQVMSIRAAVFMSEQVCPYEEEFDGNDFCSTHLIGYVGNEPAACIRIRFFAEFAKIERLAVRHEFRNGRLSFKIVWAAIELARKKGYRKLYGHAQERLVSFWSRFGFKPIDKDYELVFSDFAYREMVNEVEPDPEPITVSSNPYVIIRPEGHWHEAGILEHSASRPVSSPLLARSAA